MVAKKIGKYLTFGGEVLERQPLGKSVLFVVKVHKAAPLCCCDVAVMITEDDYTAKIRRGDTVLVCDAIAIRFDDTGRIEAVETTDITRMDPKYWEEQTMAHLRAKDSWEDWKNEPSF